MLSFISALYNEQDELADLIGHVTPYVDGLYFADDRSIDETPNILRDNVVNWLSNSKIISFTILPEHTGLPETVKAAALDLVPAGSWVLMLDADERFAPGVLDSITGFREAVPDGLTHVYFRQIEIIDGRPIREFQKSKLFKKEAITFSTGIHADDVFEGPGLYMPEWVVYHRKSSEKQKQREKEYLATYDKLFEEGKIDEGRRQWLRGLHHYYN